MDYAIFQIDFRKDKERVRFASYKETIEWAGRVDSEIYKEVWRDKIRRAMPESVNEFLEQLFYVFNNSNLKPDGYKGISMSVSDVIVVGDKAYFVDSFGFTPIDAGGFVV